MTTDEIPEGLLEGVSHDSGYGDPDTGRISPNVEPAKKLERCLEYILVHEFARLIERVHSDRFIAIMDGYLPGWRHRRGDDAAARTHSPSRASGRGVRRGTARA